MMNSRVAPASSRFWKEPKSFGCGVAAAGLLRGDRQQRDADDA